MSSLNNLNLSKYSYQFTPAETTTCGNSTGDFLVYIAIPLQINVVMT